MSIERRDVHTHVCIELEAYVLHLRQRRTGIEIRQSRVLKHNTKLNETAM